MILVLNNADFSDNNIGKVLVNENPFTRKIFEAYTRFSDADPQYELVNTFVNTLDEIGVLQHIGFFTAPWLAADINEAFYELINEEQLPTTGMSYTQGGYVDPSSTHNYVTLTNTVPTVNFFAVIRTQKKALSPWIGGSNVNIVFMESFDQPCISRMNNNTQGQYGYTVDTDHAASELDGGIVINVKSNKNHNTDGSSFNNISLTAGANAKSQEPNAAELSKYAPSYSGNAKYILMAGDGTNLTSEQITAFVSALNTLRTGLLALE